MSNGLMIDGNTLADERVRLAVDADLGRVRHLFDENDDPHGVPYSPRFSFAALSLMTCEAMTSRWIWLVPS